MERCLGYLSGAPRVSTKATAELNGPRSHVLGTIRAFKTLGWEVEPYIVGDQVPDSWISQGSEQKISRGLLRALAADGLRLVMSQKNSRRAFQQLGHKVDWVYERFGAFQSMGRPFQQRGIPWILETNAILHQESKVERKTIFLSNLVRQLEAKAYEQCDVLVVISELLKERIIDKFKISPNKIRVVPNGVDTDFINPEKYTKKRIFKSFTIGFIGTLYPWQGLDLLLKAMKALKEDNILLNLVIVGDGPMRRTLEELTSEFGLSSHVHYLGRLPQEQLFPFVLGCDFCYSGHFDSLGEHAYRSPLKIYEYMSMGRPVIASEIGGLDELICQDKTGFLFQPGSFSSLKQTLIKAFNSLENADKMGSEARSVVLEKHSWTSRIETLIKHVELNLKNSCNKQ